MNGTARDFEDATSGDVVNDRSAHFHDGQQRPQRARSRSFSVLIAAGMLLASAGAQAADSDIETAALRCSALSQMHSTLTVPSPQFGEVMGEIAGLYAQIYASKKAVRTGEKVAPAALRTEREKIMNAISKGWPKNKNAVVREAALCNLWRIGFFDALPEKATEKEFQAALARVPAPPASVTQPDIDKWMPLTTQAIGAWAQIRVRPGGSK